MFSKKSKKHDPKDDKKDDKKSIPIEEEKSADEQKDDLLSKIEGLTNIEEELKDAESKIHHAEKQAEEMTAAYKRALADLENYRRRTDQEKTEFVKYACSNLLLEVFPCLDNFKKSLEFIPEDAKKENWVQGLIHSVTFFETTLQKQGIEELDCLGQRIDPNLHDALMQGPGEKDVIIEVLEKGYKYQGKVIKHAKVKVGNGEKEEEKGK